MLQQKKREYPEKNVLTALGLIENNLINSVLKQINNKYLFCC